MTFIIVENLRGFFNSRPPLVVFMICLASFAIALITFAYIVKTKDMPNPDLTEDWNTLLQSLADLSFCMSQNASVHNASGTGAVRVGDLSAGEVIESIKNNFKEGQKTTTDTQETVNRHARAVTISSTHQDAPTSKDKSEPTHTGEESTTNRLSVSPVGKDGILNVTLNLNVEVTPNHELLTLSLSAVQLTAEITGGMLKMTGSNRDKKVMVKFDFKENLSQSNCEVTGSSGCGLYVVPACITLSGPVSMLPRIYGILTAKQDDCANDGGDTVIRNLTVATLSVSSSQNWCTSGAHIKAVYSVDDSFTIFLSQEDRSMINLHLMRTSYFLFVMVVTLFCYAIVKGRPAKVKTATHSSYEKVSMQA